MEMLCCIPTYIYTSRVNIRYITSLQHALVGCIYDTAHVNVYKHTHLQAWPTLYYTHFARLLFVRSESFYFLYACECLCRRGGGGVLIPFTRYTEGCVQGNVIVLCAATTTMHGIHLSHYLCMYVTMLTVWSVVCWEPLGSDLLGQHTPLYAASSIIDTVVTHYCYI